MMNTNTPIFEITTPVEDAIDHYKTVKKDATLGETFHEAGGRLGLIRNILGSFPEQSTVTLQAQLSTESSQIQSTAQTDQDQPAKKPPQTVETSFIACKGSAMLLKDLFQKISSETSTTRLQLYREFLEDNGKDKLVESLVSKLMQNICLLAHYYGIEEGRLQGLRAAINGLRSRGSSDPNMQTEVTRSYSNSGSGYQFISSSGSTQNNSTGNGTNLNGANFHAPVSFGGN